MVPPPQQAIAIKILLLRSMGTRIAGPNLASIFFN